MHLQELLLFVDQQVQKTSTLYSCLSKINTEEKNIVTIEDPVEFNLEGINQIPVNPKIEWICIWFKFRCTTRSRRNNDW